ncbi:MAG: glycine zipper 2TM domain-containing protein [Proteobacteria bacterium]|nr:glycine zipper 2TM domain-containing protein [Pseudomonadota bacterium]
MKLRSIVSFALILFFSSEVFASNVKVDYATVIDAEPILKTIRVSTPRQKCWEEEIADYYRYDDHRYASDGHRGVSTLVGGVVGGAIGNAVGHRKRNRQVGAVVGAVLGAVIGNAYGLEKHHDHQTVSYRFQERCRVIEEFHVEERIVGYNVRYRYGNTTYSTRTEADPGDTIKVRIAISPII